MHAKDVLGKSGEQAAAEYLESCGLRILDRNWRCAIGEIDIVAVERHDAGDRRGQGQDRACGMAARSRPSAGPSGPGCAGWRCSG